MISPLVSGAWIAFDEVESTQDVAKALLRDPNGPKPGVVYARHQSAGHGRFGRTWHSVGGESLTFSMVFSDYANHPKPWLVGMAAAVAAASALHCQIRWPNDLTLKKAKLGGILTEMGKGLVGESIPIVGIGDNLKQSDFPEDIRETATSLAEHRRGPFDPETLARRIVDRLAELPEPDSWSRIHPIWDVFDDTPGKPYRLTDGTMAVAIGVGPEGELLCSVDGESHTVMAADAIFGA